MQRYRIECPHSGCARSIGFPEVALGQRIRCPACKREVRLPGTVAELQPVSHPHTFRFRVLEGPALTGSEYPLEPGGVYTFGNSGECRVRLPGPGISKRHFAVHWSNKRWVLEDLKTTVGTLVNGAFVSDHVLQSGDTIAAGAYVLMFLTPGVTFDPGTNTQRPVEADATPAVQPATATDDTGTRETNGPAPRDQNSARKLPPDSEPQSPTRGFRVVVSRIAMAAVALVVISGLLLWSKGSLRKPPAPPSPVVAINQQQPFVLPAQPPQAIDAQEPASDVLLQATTLSTDARAQDVEPQPTAATRPNDEDLLTRASRAVADEDWAAVVGLWAQARAEGALGAQWKPIENACREQQLAQRVQEALNADDWPAAQRILVEFESFPATPRLEQLRSALLARLGAGLRLHVEPPIAQITASLDGLRLDAVERDQWMLAAGRAVLRVAGPDYFPYEQPVQLAAGRLNVVNIALEPYGPPQIWALLVLERAEAFPALAIAARHYALTGALPVESTTAFLDLAALHGKSRAGRPLRVAEFALPGDERILGRITDEVADSFNVKVLPAGTSRVLVKRDIVLMRELEPEAATEAVLGWLTAQRESGWPPLKVLQEMARLCQDLGDDALAARLCGPLLDTVLDNFETACAACAGDGTLTCAGCAGKGRRKGNVACDYCRGSGAAHCLACDGRATQRCQVCSGRGSTTHIELKHIGNGAYQNREVEVKCTTCRGTGSVRCAECNGTGKRTCPKCHGNRDVEAEVPCSECRKGLITCPACSGAGTRAAMAAEAREQAERDARRRAGNGQ